MSHSLKINGGPLVVVVVIRMIVFSRYFLFLCIFRGFLRGGGLD
jgi:hypothetical protein